MAARMWWAVIDDLSQGRPLLVWGGPSLKRTRFFFVPAHDASTGEYAGVLGDGYTCSAPLHDA